MSCSSIMPRVPRLTALLAACLALLVATTHLPTGVQAASIESNRRDNGFPDLYEATFEELQSGLDGGKFTSVDLVKAYFARIEEVNTNGATLRAVGEISPSALQYAADLDTLRAQGKKKGPLHGIPIIVKDNIGTQFEDGMNTTAGSYALLNSIVGGDSTVVAKLKASGAIILGKANLSQWAFWRSSGGIPSGWTSRFGQCSNPYYPGGDPSGSSGGSAISTAIGLSAAALYVPPHPAPFINIDYYIEDVSGSDTGGSVIWPASKQNVVGIRPTIGLVSRTGVVPLAVHHDTVGPIARTVTDAAHLLQAIAGPDPTDNYTVNDNTIAIPSYTAGLKKDALKGVRIGAPWNLNGNILYVAGNQFPTNVISTYIQAIKDLESVGATVVNMTLDGYQDILNTNHTYVFAADFRCNIRDYLATLKRNPQSVNNLADLVAFNDDHPELEEPATYDHQDEWLLSMGTNCTTDSYYLSSVAQESVVGKGNIDAALAKYDVSAMVFPAPQSLFSAVAGYPQVVVPMGFLPENTTAVPVGYHPAAQTYDPFPHTPFGLTFAGTGYSEAKLLAYAYAYEQATQHRFDRVAYPSAIPTTQIADVL